MSLQSSGRDLGYQPDGWPEGGCRNGPALGPGGRNPAVFAPEHLGQGLLGRPARGGVVGEIWDIGDIPAIFIG